MANAQNNQTYNGQNPKDEISRRVVYYSSFDFDPVQEPGQNKTLPDNYDWIRPASRLKPLFRIFAKVWWKQVLHAHVQNPELLKPYFGKPAFLFLQHTQPFGDPFLPGLLLDKQPFYSICLPANLSTPILGPLLPGLGALPLPGTLAGMRAFRKAIHQRVEENAWIVVYPEAHVWPWCTFVRPFKEGSMQYAIDENVPCFCAGVIYKQGKHRRPDIEIRLSGPFYPDASLKRPARRRTLEQAIFQAMEKGHSPEDPAWIEYKEEKGDL